MNKQQKTYGLLIAVFVIWGIIGYQIYIRLNPPILELKASEVNSSFVRQQINETSFYEVQANYRDPFLGKLPEKKKVIQKSFVEPKMILPFPSVIYNGIIEGNNSKAYILTINGKQEIVIIGQEIQKIKLIKADSKQAIVKFEGIQKILLLQ